MPVDPRIQRILEGPLTTPTDLRFAPKRGYARPPGTGPFGETCGSCRHPSPLSSYAPKHERVCGLIERVLSDPPPFISLWTEACSRWERRP